MIKNKIVKYKRCHLLHYSYTNYYNADKYLCQRVKYLLVITWLAIHRNKKVHNMKRYMKS